MTRRVVFVLAILLIAASCAAALEYQAVPLSPLDGYAGSLARGISPNGLIVGSSSLGPGAYWTQPQRACYWDASGVHELPMLPGRQNSTAYAANSAGVIVGSVDGGLPSGSACYWDAGGIHDLDSLFPEHKLNKAVDIDERGHILLSGRTPEGLITSFIWDGVTLAQLPYASFEEQWASGSMNSQDQAVGEKSSSQGQLWDNGVVTDLQGLPDYPKTMPFDINELGDIVGCARSSYLYKPVLWTGGNVVELGVGLGYDYGVGCGINNGGLVAGCLYGGSRPYERACFWDADGIHGLPLLEGTSYSTARWVNDAGWIVGMCDDGSLYTTGTPHACLWTPVPEPSGALYLLAGLVVPLVLRRR